MITGCTSTVVRDAGSLHALIAKGNANRVTANTKLNSSSSRSHACLLLTITRKPIGVADESVGTCARLNLIDLAGSERVAKSGAHGDNYKEAVAINKSLTVLGTCIHGLVNGEKHIAFRDSKLTRILQPCLTGKGRTSIIVTVQPSSADASETTCTLKFGERALRVQAQMTTGDYRELLHGAEAALADQQNREGDVNAELHALRRLSEQARQRLQDLQSRVDAQTRQNEQALAAVRSELESGFNESEARYARDLEKQRELFDAEHERLRADNSGLLAVAEEQRKAAQAAADQRVADGKAEQDARLARAKARTDDLKAQPEPVLPDEGALRERLEQARARVRDAKQRIRDCTPSANRDLSTAELRKKAARLRLRRQRLGAKARELLAIKQEQAQIAAAEKARGANDSAATDRTVTASDSGGETAVLREMPRAPSGTSSDLPPSAASTPSRRSQEPPPAAALMPPTPSSSSSFTSSSLTSSSSSSSPAASSTKSKSPEPPAMPEVPKETPKEAEARLEAELFERVEVRQFRNATRRETHLHHLVEQILVYLDHGCTMTRVFLPGGDSIKLHRNFVRVERERSLLTCCTVDGRGLPNKEDYEELLELKDIKDIKLGQYVGSFQALPESAQPDPDGGLSPRRAGDPGSVVDEITVESLPKHFYRSISLRVGRERYLDLVADTDTDFEAWIVALHRLTRIDPQWGDGLDLSDAAKFPRSSLLSPAELEMCSRNHITPQRYLDAKSAILSEPSQPRLYLTLYDVRMLSECDLLHSQKLFEFFHAQKWIEKRPVHILTHTLREAIHGPGSKSSFRMPPSILR
eukprot:TRINITY_DN2576_c0_g1_i1.p1 TRINITY_DN2576_c0_g1~~TRINITY_DN2576_c0_g1_i1.p1  ORF type:complete len:815 (+),score=226.22 TRINITY_DN2576_c0_g1_i1:594-3038(+)